MKRPEFALGIIIVLVGGLMGICMQAELFRNFIYAATALFYLTPFVLLIGLIVLVKRLMKRVIGRVLTVIAVLSCSVFAAIIVFYFAQRGIDDWKNTAVRSYVSRAAPILDSIKKRDGAYPSKLPLSELGEPPSLLRDFGEYSSDGYQYYFEYVDDPAGWAGGEGALRFNSSDGKWMNDR